MKNVKLKIFVDPSALKGGHAVRGIGMYTRSLTEALKKQNEVELVNQKEGVDAVHYSYFDLFFDTLKLSNKPTVVTVYDVIPLIYPKQYPPGIKGRLRFFLQKNKLKNVDAVITISGASKKDIVRFLDIQEEKIYPIYLAPPLQFKRISKDTLIRMGVSRRYKLPERFILYVGDVNYNKNIEGLLQAFSILMANKSEYTNNSIGLVLVGKAFKDDIPETRKILQLVKELNLEDLVVMPGFVPDADLAGIYNLAAVYCQPSFYEGFGLPVLEAMACGTPVAASRTQALVEIAEGAACFFNPHNPSDIASVLADILNKPVLREELSKSGLLHVENFSWQKTAKETIDVYKKVVNK